MIPLHKKAARDDLNNYRDVCILPLISRIIARIYASRIRVWAEEIEILDENQNGFREGRSTCDATQMILKIDEEVRRVFGKCRKEDERTPSATLLDVTKAYPRVSKPLMWTMLENLSMPQSVLDSKKPT